MTRDRDERDLSILRAHCDGHAPAQIAAVFGLAAPDVVAVVAAITAADMEHDPAAIVYWHQRGAS